jgi:di/tripeptidase
MNIRQQVYRKISEMTGIEISEINSETDIDEIFLYLTQELDGIFRIPLHKNHGSYESSSVDSVVKYYEALVEENEI